MNGRSLAVTATLETEVEVDQLIAMLTATKVLLPKAPPPSPMGVGAIEMD